MKPPYHPFGEKDEPIEVPAERELDPIKVTEALLASLALMLRKTTDAIVDAQKGQR
jgi:hypothetical protein